MGDPRAALLGRALDEALSAQMGPVRHARPGPFGVLNRNSAPSALIEIAYLTHPEDAAMVQDPSHQERFADAVVDGIANYLAALSPAL
jgi:N-acetylmuramoyl-L-alanine amidase